MNHDADTFGFFAILLLFLLIAVYRNREKIRANVKRFAALNQKIKQLIVLLAVAVWYTGCFIYFANEPYYNPDHAAFVALIYTTPTIAFGGIALWWLAQAKKDK